MRIFPALSTFAAIACLSPVWAQNGDVTVGGTTGRVLIDPATGQQRFVPDLLQPWQMEPIRLHPLGKHRATNRAASTTAAKASGEAVSSNLATEPQAAEPKKHRSTRRTASAATTAPTPEPALPSDSFGSVTANPPAPAAPSPVTPAKPKPKKAASAAPRPAAAAPQSSAPAPVSGISDFTDLISPQPTQPAPKKKAAPPPETPRAAEAPKPAVTTPRAVEKPVQKASVEPSKPYKAHISAGTKKDTVAFAPNASDPSTAAVAAIRSLAGSLNSALNDASARVQLMAYAGMRGEKSSDTRRLSLKRALVVRQLLIDDGVPAERIDVFALGGVDDDGPLDRVDVLIKS